MERKTVTHLKLIAEPGMVLYNGTVFGKEVYLGAQDSPENWQTVPETELAAISSPPTMDIMSV